MKADDSRKNLYTASDKEQSFEEVMKMVDVYGKAFQEAGKLADMTAIVKKEFGNKDVKISKCTPDQKHVVEVVLNKLKLLASELGINVG